jgi:hypothetical protein
MALLCLSINPCISQINSTFRIDLDEIRPEYASRIIEKCEYIPLQYTKESEIMKVDKILITDKRIIIVDNLKNAIFFFDRKGHFISSIKGLHQVKSGLPTYLYKYVWLDHFNKEINITTNESKYFNSIFKYDLNGKFIAVESKQSSNHKVSEVYATLSSSKRLYTRELTYDMNQRPMADSAYFYIKDTAGVILQKQIKIDSFSKFANPSDLVFPSGDPFIQDESGETFATIPYKYNIYKFDSSGLMHIHEIKFTMKNSLPEDFLYGSQYDKKRIQFMKDNPGIVYGISNAVIQDHLLFFEVGSYDNHLKGALILYNMKTNQLINLEQILPDESNSYLPLFSTMSGYGFFKKSFYSCIYPANLFAAEKENNTRKRKIDYPEKIDKILERNEEEVNPVVVIMKFK